MKMNRTERPSEHEAIEATAANWLAERDEGLSAEQQTQLTQWLEADPRHREALARLEATWGALQQLRYFRPESARHPDCDLMRVPAQPLRGKYTFPAWSAAAALLVATLWFYTARQGPVDPQQVFATAADGYESVMLMDGSQLELNASTEVQVQYTATERRVRLIKGEAHFTVAKNKARPFTVEAGKVAVHAVGTAFNVSLAPTAVDVLVSEGKVKVTDLPPRAIFSSLTASDPRRYPDLLVANQRLHILTSGTTGRLVPSETLTEPAMRQALLWKERRLVFAETPLGEVILQFNRLNRVQLQLGDESLAARPVGGNFHADNLDVFVNLLVKTHEITAERPDADHIVLRQVK